MSARLPKIGGLNEREREVLSNLSAAEFGFPGRNGWLTPMMFGGRDASHHSATANRLVRAGLVERDRRAGHCRPSYLYRITAAGRRALAASLEIKGLYEDAVDEEPDPADSNGGVRP